MSQPSVSVVIPCYDERRWPRLRAAVDSVRRQTLRPAEIVLVVDHNDALLRRARTELDGVTVLANQFARGVSGNRNTGVFHTRTPIVALLDDDAVAHEHWLKHLVAPLADPATVGTGGTIRPSWHSRPSWFPQAFLWAVGGSYSGQPDTAQPVRNVWSASMAVRREVFDEVNGFRTGFGKLGDRSRPEDTDLCLRMTQHTGKHWIFSPEAIVWHPVPRERATLRYFVRRCYHEGRGKIEMARLQDGQPSLEAERDYLKRTVPRAIVRGFTDTARGRDRHGWAKSLASVAGVGAAGLGAAVEFARVPRAATEPTTRPEEEVPR